MPPRCVRAYGREPVNRMNGEERCDFLNPDGNAHSIIVRARRRIVSTIYFHLLSVTLAVLAPLIVTYPLALQSADAMFHPGDNFITLWTTAWQVHALTAPDETFWNANILHPYPRTMALSVLRVIYILFAWLALTLMQNPVWMENWIILGSMILSGLGMYWFCYALTRSRLAALLAAIVFTCNPERFSRMPHPHQLNPIFFGPALLMAFRYWERYRWKYALGAIVCLYLQFLTSIYLSFFLGIALLITAAVEYPAWRDRARNVGITAVVCLVLWALAAAPFAAPYLMNRLQWEYSDATDWLIDSSARPADYLMAWHHNLLYGWTESAFAVPRAIEGMIPPNFLFPGLIPLLIWGVGSLWMHSEPQLDLRRLFRQGTWLAVAGILFSFGPWLHWGTRATTIPMPAWILYALPGVSVIRAPARFAILASLGLAMILAAVFTSLQARIKWRRRVWAVTLAGLVFLECLNHPLPLQQIPRGEGIPTVEHWLASRPERVVVYYPLRYHLAYMYFSCWHWKRLINGWSGYLSKEMLEDERRMNLLPSPEAIETLRRRGAELIVIYSRFDTDPPFLFLQPDEEQGVRYYLGELRKRPDLFEPVYENGSASVFRFWGERVQEMQ